MTSPLMQNVRFLIKQANEITPQPHIANAQNAEMAAGQGAVDAHALQSGGTVEQLQLESLKKGLETPSAQASGVDQVVELQKAAALSQLVSEGMDFYSAFDKVATFDLELQKEAAFNDLIGEGYSFDDAVALIQGAAAE